MLNRLQLLQSIGNFPAVSAAKVPFGRITFGYADNGRGKTTIAAILRSLSTGEPVHLVERTRLGATTPVKVVVDCAGKPAPAVFDNGAWTFAVPEIVVFDEQFVADNVCSGLAVGTVHRQNLHELILGARGVALIRAHQALVDKIEDHNRALRARAAAIPATELGGLSVDDFCSLPAKADMDSAIEDTTRALAAAGESLPVQQHASFRALALPAIDVDRIRTILGRCLPGLEARAAARVRAHLSLIGRNGEGWVAEGMHHFEHAGGGTCPFCAQDSSGSPVIAHYQSYFGAEYRALKGDIAEAVRSFKVTHDGDAVAGFERSVRVWSETRQFWARFCDVPQLQLDTSSIVTVWVAARDVILAALEAKAAAPLETPDLSQAAIEAAVAYEAKRQEVEVLSAALVATNAKIDVVKKSAAAGDVAALSRELAKLKATKARHTSPTSDRCAEYLQEKAAKSKTEAEREAARSALDRYRTEVFPEYQKGVNGYLERFGASFALADVQPVNSRAGASCAYNVVVNNVAIPAADGGGGQPTFRTVLSGGDRSTLALAFFLTSIDLDSQRANKIVVFDDPVSSFDEHRALTTVQCVRDLSLRTAQVIVLSHSKTFLCRVWDSADPTLRASFQVVRGANGSTIEAWSVEADSVTEHDRRYAVLCDYVAGKRRACPEIARAIRPTLEAFFRVAFPADFPPGTMCGVFRNICDQRVGTARELLDAADTRELRDIVEYANRFHHDTNPSWETQMINDAELLVFVRRTLALARRKPLDSKTGART